MVLLPHTKTCGTNAVQGVTGVQEPRQHTALRHRGHRAVELYPFRDAHL
jgi:hypothetical protein